MGGQTHGLTQAISMSPTCPRLQPVSRRPVSTGEVRKRKNCYSGCRGYGRWNGKEKDCSRYSLLLFVEHGSSLPLCSLRIINRNSNSSKLSFPGKGKGRGKTRYLNVRLAASRPKRNLSTSFPQNSPNTKLSAKEEAIQRNLDCSLETRPNIISL